MGSQAYLALPHGRRGGAEDETTRIVDT
jgi:hypothetical protein